MDRALSPCCQDARRALRRPAHLCRGRGDRACRCHQDARPAAARPIRALRIDPRALIAAQLPRQAPLRPQAPPRFLNPSCTPCTISGNRHDRLIH
ncbi:hypothetical protein [Paracoccus sp. AK26]|uniref:hypothetical protein n=1 Tax=Paracoccus sp. AK26 TaxID=2589076 RepID=UPI0014281255|nr:hypothetical protein [Paracoccus sp. AK26]QIR85758.1 hypothetical protein FIU66_11390 [Paracoccus sp. AK26]